ncbi:COX15/CtaA family protein [Aquipuribacter hungaricus]|uniref:Heme A synthase n=1 Tax=Aquipuribacter hungaricus TaxID=545624 RepID=A0ABV7WCK3_9MICO
MAAPPARLPRVVTIAVVVNLVVQVGIVVTGGLVRLTASGLGCPTWPECVPGSFTPTVEQELGIHPVIEFGNRTLTGVVAVAALAVVVLLWLYRRRLLGYGLAVLVGTALQAVLGGITVLTGLHPATVAAHFLVSALLVAVSAALLLRLHEPDGPRRLLLPAPLRLLTAGLVLAGSATVVVGTLVTGSGPHSGDAEVPVRFDLDPRAISTLHAEGVVLFLGLLLGLLAAVHALGVPALLRRRTWQLLAVTLSQGGIGYVQYFTGLPRALVNLHMLGACLLVVALVALVMATRVRGPVAGPDGADDARTDAVTGTRTVAGTQAPAAPAAAPAPQAGPRPGQLVTS